MELRKDVILFINLLFRIITLIGFVSNFESPNLPINDAILNWNTAITNQMILILANGLRDDFLQMGKTPFLQEIATKNGDFAIARIDEIVTIEGSLKSLITGLPWHGSLLPWNRPKKYTTILDYAPCKCLIGQLPLKNKLSCHEIGQNQSEVFEKFQKMSEPNCLYVLSFDFGGISGRDYIESLERLDEDIRKIMQKWKDATWLLTSGRGSSIWNRTDGRVDVPVLIWGKGIVHTNATRILQLPDISALVSTLLGQSFPAGGIGHIPTDFISGDIEKKFQMILYNFEHLEKSLGHPSRADEYDSRNLEGIIDEGNFVSLKISVENFQEMIQLLRMNRMKMFSIIILTFFLIWSIIFLEVIVCGYLTINLTSFLIFLSIIAAVVLCTFHYPEILQIAVMLLLTPITFVSFPNFLKYFYAEGYRLFLLSINVLTFSVFFAVIGNQVTILLMMILVGSWPIFFHILNRINKKIILLWLVSITVLVSLLFFDVIGREPSLGVIILSGFFHIGFFHFIFRSFKRRTDRQSWIITSVVLFTTYHVYFCSLWGFTAVSRMISWCLLLFAIFYTFMLHGTLCEIHLKLQLVLLVPMQLLSTGHEPFFHLALSIFVFCWIFIENTSLEKNIICYSPSIFSLECPAEYFKESLQAKHYRQVFFFLMLSYMSFFAAGNYPTIYTYDYAILKPFFGNHPFFLIPLKLFLPFISLLHAFLTLLYSQKTNPAILLIIFIHFSDVAASFFLIYTYILKEFFTMNVSYYIILQIATAAITAFYFFHKYLYFLRNLS